MPTLISRFRAWLAQVLAVPPGKPHDGLVELSVGTTTVTLLVS
jgi:hypothetical protein